MSNKITTIKERVLQIPETKGVTKQKFFKDIGMSYGNFTGKSKETPLNSNAIGNISSIYPDISLDWLINGSGDMLIYKKETEFDTNIVNDVTAEYGLKRIPLVHGSAIGGFGGGQFSIDKADVKDYYVVPKFKNKQIDFMIEVEGSSMYPKYNSGDIVACRIINESSFIQWNKTHIVATNEQGILIKRIKPCSKPEFVTMVSDNKDYDPFDVSMDEISGLAIVIGVIRLE